MPLSRYSRNRSFRYAISPSAQAAGSTVRLKTAPPANKSFLFGLLELSLQSLVVTSLRALHQLRVLRNATPRFINSWSADHFDCQNVSGLKLSLFPLEVFTYVAFI